MEFLHNGFTLDIATGTFPLSTDSILLSAFAKLPSHATVLDLGSGCGTLGVLLCARDPGCRVTGIELDPAAHAQAQRNIQRNMLEGRLSSICADLRTVPSLVAPGSFSCCISNPPYFSGGPSSSRVPQARRDDLCSTDELFDAAQWALRYGGDFFLVQKPERLAQLCACGARRQMEAKRLLLVRHRPQNPVSLILLQFRKGGKPGLTWEELCLFDDRGNPTDDYQKIYHIYNSQ